jgi:hypothetical protein
MLRHSTLFPVNSLQVSDTFRVHHQEINKINCICNLWYGNSIVLEKQVHLVGFTYYANATVLLTSD